MAEISKAVNHRHAAVLCQSFHFVLAERADHDAIHIPGQHPGGILNRLAPADLGPFRSQHHRIAAQLVDAYFKRHPGAGRGFLKDHPQAFPLQNRVGDAVLRFIFQLVGQVQNLQDFLAGQIQQL